MQDYDYKEGRKRINAILNSKTKIKESTRYQSMRVSSHMKMVSVHG